MRMLDLFSGRFGWGRAFAARGWDVVGIDLTLPGAEYIPEGATVIQRDILSIDAEWVKRNQFDFICASSPCEEFSVHGMKHFHPNPKYPELGIKLFNHTRMLCEESGVPYVMENVRAAQDFVGEAFTHCGPFYLWGSGIPSQLQGDLFGDHKPVPTALPKGVSKGIDVGSSKLVKTMNKEERREYRAQFKWNQAWSSSPSRGRDTAKAATIPPELASCVCDYAERILERAA